MFFSLFVFAECRSAKCYSNECHSATAVNYERKTVYENGPQESSHLCSALKMLSKNYEGEKQEGLGLKKFTMSANQRER